MLGRGRRPYAYPPAARLALALALTVLGAGSGAMAAEHETWDRLLQQYVDDDGRVAYKALALHDRPALDRYLGELAAADPEPRSPDAAKAFWINAYNAGVFAAVLAGYSAESFLGRRGIFKRFTFEIAGERRTLDDIEHGIVRPRLEDPRTHFALVCASSSCPRLRRRAYTEEGIERALEEEARRFINDAGRNVIDPASRTVQLSEIFRWFAEDFVAAAGSVEAFVARYVESEAKRSLLREKAGALAYLSYDWTMNAQPGQRP